MPALLRKLSIIDTGTLSNTLTFSVVQEGASQASRQAVFIEPASEGNPIIENNRELTTSKKYNVACTGLFNDTSGKSTLNGYLDNNTEVTLAGIGLDGQILQAEGILNGGEEYESNLSFRFESPREATGDYSDVTGKHTADMIYCKNGLAMYRWADDDGDGLANGWSKSGGTTTFSAGEQFFSTTAGGGATMTRRVYFPFAGHTLRFTANLATANTSTGTYIEIKAYNSADSELDNTLATWSGLGEESVSLVLPAGTIYVECIIGIAQNDDIGFTNPVLGVGQYRTFIEYNT